MKKFIKITLLTTLLLSMGCSNKKIESVEGHYSGTTFLIESGEYYNVGIELHYDNDTELEWNYSIENQLDLLLQDLEDPEVTVVDLVEDGKYYCTDAIHSKKSTWRKGYSITHDKHDELVSLLEDFSFDLTLNANATDKEYSSEVTLPLTDVSEQRAEEEKAKEEAEQQSEE